MTDDQRAAALGCLAAIVIVAAVVLCLAAFA